MPPNSLIKMSKYIEAERNRGYDNRAVLGGMDKITGNLGF